MKICQTDRLTIRQFTLTDVEYVLQQLNDAAFIQYIADKNVRSIGEAENYLRTGPIASYEKNDFGLNLVELSQSKVAIGMCGLVKRQELDHPDLGFAFLPQYWGKGYALEASKAILNHAIDQLNMNLVLGVTMQNNLTSNKLLKKLGFILTGEIELYNTLNNFYEYRISYEDN